MATGTNIGGSHIGSFSGAGSLSITVSAAVARGHSVLVSFGVGMSGGTIPTSITCTDNRGNTYTLDRGGNNGTKMFLRLFRSNLATALQVGDTITITWNTGLSSGARATMRAMAFDRKLAKVSDATVDSAFTTSIDVTFTRSAADQLFFAASCFGGDDSAVGSGDPQWTQWPLMGNNDINVVGGYRSNPAANDSWNYPLLAARDCWGSGVVYDESVATFGGAQSVVLG